MIRSIFLFILFSLSGTIVNAQSNSIDFISGEEWITFGKTEMNNLYKVIYIRGVYDATILSSEKPSDLEIPLGLGWETISRAVDEFYSNPSNIKIPVYEAIEVYFLQVQGVSSAKIESRLNELRNFYYDY